MQCILTSFHELASQFESMMTDNWQQSVQPLTIFFFYKFIEPHIYAILQVFQEFRVTFCLMQKVYIIIFNLCNIDVDNFPVIVDSKF